MKRQREITPKKADHLLFWVTIHSAFLVSLELAMDMWHSFGSWEWGTDPTETTLSSWLELGCDVWHAAAIEWPWDKKHEDIHQHTEVAEPWGCHSPAALMPETMSFRTSYYVRKWALSLPLLSLVGVSVLAATFLPNRHGAQKICSAGQGC